MRTFQKPLVHASPRPIVILFILSACSRDAPLTPDEPADATDPAGPAAGLVGSTVPNLKVAFIGDQGTSDAVAVLQRIRDEGADLVLHQGDFDYGDDPTAWDEMITSVLGADFPYFASVGNHDDSLFYGAGGYQAKLQQRLDRVTGATCTGDLGVSSACEYQGLFFILSGVGTLGSGHESYIRQELEADNSIWRICSWHKNQNAMQVGGKGDDVGWGPYEACRELGAIIATAHEHSYHRTKTLVSAELQTVDPAWPDPATLRVAPGATFVFVSGLGGASIRNQDRCRPTTYPYGCNGEWASIYTSDQSAQYGALFIEFHVDGEATKARGYFKNIDGAVVDQFTVTSQISTGGPIADFTFTEDPLLTVTFTDASSDPDGSLMVWSWGFGDGQTSSERNPSHTYAAAGVYTVTLTVTDNDGLTGSRMMSVPAGPQPSTVEVRVAAGGDDAEERSSGSMYMTSSDLELVFDGSDQTVGMRFNAVAIPRGSSVTDAYIQFQVDETTSDATTLTIEGEAADDAAAFASSDGDISSRPRTTAAVSWSPVPWTTKGLAGPDQRTPNIASVIQEIAQRPGWTTGNSLVIIITGAGKRVAESYDGDLGAAPLLHLEYSTQTTPNDAPVAGDDVGSVAEGGMLDQAAPGLLANDSDPENDPLTVTPTPVTPPVNGTLTLNGDGSYSYTHDGSQTTSDSFVYEVCDTGPLCDTATVEITVTGVDGSVHVLTPAGSDGYSSMGGRNADRHLDVKVTLVDGTGAPVTGASVSARISGPTPGGGTGTTDSSGVATFRITNAASGTYTTEVTDVTAAGLTWDGLTPPNSFVK